MKLILINYAQSNYEKYEKNIKTRKTSYGVEEFLEKKLLFFHTPQKINVPQ
jgi:hypothetical protein